MQSPWQKGAVENANRRLRRWLDRDTDLHILTAGFNYTPCKCLSYRTQPKSAALISYNAEGANGAGSTHQSRAPSSAHSLSRPEET